MAYLGALHSASSLRRAASSNSCLPASVRLHQCMCWMRFELHRIPWKVQPGSRDCASSSWLRALAAYSLQLRIGTTPLSPRHESSVFWRSPYSRPRSRGDAPLHQLTCSTGSGLHRGPAKLQPVAIWTWLIARATYSSQLSIGSGPRLPERTQMSRAERWRAGELWRLWVSSSLNPLDHETGGCRRRKPTRG